ncbi:MAG: prepilin peptidase [Alphaproteobacteria bacterium]|nr:prepilin peptidase [Alphaproteobacteria bacterium]
MTYILCGFIYGLFIPYLARRIGKLMPATMGYILLKLFVPSHSVAYKKLENNPQYMELFRRYVMRSIGWGIFTAGATYLFATDFGVGYSWWYVAFLWILLLLVEIDKRFELLPDILTWPLLLLGFAYAAQHGPWLATPDINFLSYTENSALGAIMGYVIPVVASMFLVWKYPDAFGGGDIKLLCAIGAWVGMEVIGYIILGSCIVFAGACIINRKRVGAFGPSIVYATLTLCLFLF